MVEMGRMKKILIVLTFVMLSVTLVVFYLQSKKMNVTNFEECVAAGNPVMESYPRQCRADGVLYVEEINDTSKPANDSQDLPLASAQTNAKNDLAEKLGIDVNDIEISQVEEKEWPDACLGISDGDTLCAQVITPGYLITLNVNETTYLYRTDLDGKVVIAEN